MSEVVFLHVGQAGVQIATPCWDLFCLEHNIMPDGHMSVVHRGLDTSFCPLFSETPSGKYIPRALLVDLEPATIHAASQQSHDLFHPNQLLSGKEDAANNFARGHYTVGKECVNEWSAKVLGYDVCLVALTGFD